MASTSKLDPTEIAFDDLVPVLRSKRGEHGTSGTEREFSGAAASNMCGSGREISGAAAVSISVTGRTHRSDSDEAIRF
ncbi:MAG: hypothetical protein QOI11_1429 [Candidatus Eremiobacteraeota bacterium]|jgi:hypothetical protein|nr:hypothetical protein [Candidatus Eremiobacteraeota bacterium]